MVISKWTILVAAFIALLVILYFMGKKSVHHEITINASPEEVWAVLIDTDNYEHWNPAMILLEGEVRKGAKVTYQFTQDANNVSQIPSKVKQLIPNEILNQGGGLPIILTFDHKYILKPIGQDTELIIHEDYRGIGVNFWDPKPVEDAYARLNKALKKRVESLNSYR